MSSRTEGRALTPEQARALNRYRARWSAIRRSTEPADRGAAEEGVRLAYVAAGLQSPARFVWCDGPVELARRSQRISLGDGPNVRWALIDRPRRQVAARIGKRLSRRLLAEVESAVNPADALMASVADAVALATAEAPSPLFTRFRRGEPLSLSCVLLALCGREGFRYAAAGPGDLAWLSTFEYLRGVLGLKAETEPLLGLWQLASNVGWLRPHARTCWLSLRPDLLCADANDRLHHADGPALRFRDGVSVWAWRGVEGLRAETEPLLGLWQLASNGGWLRPHAQTCWLSLRPDRLCADANDRLHHADGPALRFRDGVSVWAWRGVEVPRGLIEQPKWITIAAIDAEANVQIRRCMIEIMTPRRYVAAGGAVRIAEDETGILWRRTWLASDAWAAVEVINATPEPDGTRKHFFLQVPPNLQTAREAVAWTYGMEPEVYAQLVMRT